MKPMKKRTAIAVTVGVWIAAVGSAAALTYDLNRPLPLTHAQPEVTAAFQAARVAVPEPPSQKQAVLNVPTVTIVGRTAHRPAMTAAPKLPEISRMRCADWRNLDMGSGRVQVCE